MHAAAVAFELHLPGCHSLKDKRARVRPIVEGLRHRFAVAAAEVDRLDAHQSATIGVAAVSATVGHVEEVLDSCERFVWSRPDVEVSGAVRSWLEVDR